MHVEVLSLNGGEAVGDLLEALAHGIPIGEGLFEAEIADVIADQFQAQKGGGFLVLFEEGVAAPGPEDMLAVIDPLHHVLEFTPDAAGVLFAKQGDDSVGGEQVKPQFTRALKDRANGPGALEDEIAAVLDLLHDVEAAQATTSGALFGRELRCHNQSPVVDPLLKGLAVQAVGRRLELSRLGYGDEPVIVLDEFDSLARQLSFNKIMAVEIRGEREGQKGAHAQHHRSGN